MVPITHCYTAACEKKLSLIHSSFIQLVPATRPKHFTRFSLPFLPYPPSSFRASRSGNSSSVTILQHYFIPSWDIKYSAPFLLFQPCFWWGRRDPRKKREPCCIIICACGVVSSEPVSATTATTAAPLQKTHLLTVYNSVRDLQILSNKLLVSIPCASHCPTNSPRILCMDFSASLCAVLLAFDLCRLCLATFLVQVHKVLQQSFAQIFVAPASATLHTTLCIGIYPVYWWRTQKHKK